MSAVWRRPVLILGALALSWVALPGSVGADETRWYEVLLGESRVGWMKESSTLEGDRRIEESRIEMSFARGELRQTLAMESRFEATPDGTPLEARSVQELGETRMLEEWFFGEHDILVRSSAGGESMERHLARPAEGWPRPWAEQEALEQALQAEAEAFEATVFDPQIGPTPVRVTWTLEEADVEVETVSGPQVTSRWRQVYDFAPELPTVVWVDAEGALVASRMSMMGLDLEIRRAQEEGLRASADEPPELLLRSFVRPDRVIPRPRSLRRAVYELEVERGTLTGVPSLGRQTAVQEGRQVRVTVDLEARPLPDDEVDAAQHLLATPYLDHGDPAIRAILEGAGELPEDPGLRARALRRLVAEHLDGYDLRSLLATASEVARARSGDCTEHSVLLAALLRAARIPSRVVFGVLYVDGFLGEEQIFGYHMWTQALVEGRWLDLDALLDRDFDAAHIALAVTDLRDPGSLALEMARLGPLFGRLAIRVVDLDWGEAVPAGAG